MLLHITYDSLYISGGNMNGRSTLTDLAKKMSEDNDWKYLPIEEQERLF